MRPDLHVRTSLAAAALILVGAAGCATTVHGTPLPRRDAPYTLPLVNPLTWSRTWVWAELEGPDGTVVGTRFLIDTGGYRSYLSEGTAKRLGFEGRAAPGHGTVGVDRIPHTWVGRLAPRFVSGDLVLEDMALGEDEDCDIFGDDVLSQAALTIDYDRGVVLLGGPPLEAAGRIDVPYRHVSSGSSRLDVLLNGQRTRLDIDTGAWLSIDENTGRRLGLAVRRYARPQSWESSGATWTERGTFVGRLEVGPVVMEEVKIRPLIDWVRGGLLNRKSVGLLGWRFLSPWVHRLDPDEGVLQLRPRRDVVATTRERIERWPWVPRCEEAPGCLGAELIPGTDKHPMSVGVDSSRRWEVPACVLVGFTDAAGRLRRHWPLLQVRVDLRKDVVIAAPLDGPMQERIEAVGTDHVGARILDVNPDGTCEWAETLPKLHPSHPVADPAP